VCNGLPHVKPRVVKNKLRARYLALRREKQQETELGGRAVPCAELAELFHKTSRTGYSTEVVSPAGARLLVELYRSGALDLQPRKRPEPISDALQAYCNSESQLHEKARERKAKRDVHQRYVEDPTTLPESEFSYGLLNAIFWKHLGEGNGSLVIGGREVTKSLKAYTSNSGKSRDFNVQFRWTSANGASHELERQSLYEDNRRNDEDRNWGLPE
jgi:hypothetical protein